MEPIQTEQLWSRQAMGKLWKFREHLDQDLKRRLDKLYKSRQKDSLIGTSQITYTLSKSEKKQAKLGYGRLYSNDFKGLEMLENEARGTLCKDYYHDIDVVNCQPSLLVQFAKRFFETELLEVQKFCQNRDDYYSQISSTREIAKMAVISVFFGGSCEFPFLRPLKQELDTFATKLLQLPQYFELYKACQETKPDNPKGSFLGFLAQTEERKVMLAMRKFFLSQGWSVDVLCFDGVMLRKDKTKELTDTLLEEAENAVLADTGYVVKLTNKPFATFDFSKLGDEDDEPILPANLIIDDAYAAGELVKLAGENLLSAEGELFARLDGVWLSGEDGIRRLISSHRDKLIFKQEAKTGIKIHNYGGFENKITPLLKQLKILAKPGKLPIQFAYSLVEGQGSPEHVETFLSLVRLWTRGKEAETEYVLNWLAHMIQKPTETPGVMLILTGQKGCGKDTLCNFIENHVVGRRLSKSYNSTDLFFDHYDSKQNKIFLRLQEATRAACLKNQDLLKSFITSQQLDINEKHKPSFTAPNYCHIVFTTNKGNPVAFTEQERRFLILPCSDERVGESHKNYWVSLYDTFFCAEAGKAVGEYLESRDISTFNPRVYPVSAYQEAIIETEMTPEDRFVEAWDGEELSATDLFNKYREWCAENSLPNIQFANHFCRALSRFLRDNKVEKRKSGGIMVYHKP